MFVSWVSLMLKLSAHSAHLPPVMDPGKRPLEGRLHVKTADLQRLFQGRSSVRSSFYPDESTSFRLAA